MTILLPGPLSAVVLVGLLGLGAADAATVARPSNHLERTSPRWSFAVGSNRTARPNLYAGVEGNGGDFVVAYGRNGRTIATLKLPGLSFQPVSVATDVKDDVFVLHDGTLYGYAPGESEPFETLDIPGLSLGNALALDDLGNFFVGTKCPDLDCTSQEGALAEYDSSGNLKYTFPNCLLSYYTLAVNRLGNVFASGLLKNTKSGDAWGVVEFRSATSKCHTVVRHFAPVVVNGKDLVVDLGNSGSPPVAVVETLQPRSYHRVRFTTNLVEPQQVFTIRIAMQHGGRAIWNAISTGNYSYRIVEYPYESGTVNGISEVRGQGVISSIATRR
jgi:hypothetical protein